MGYTAEVAVSDDHLIVAQRVHQAPTDNGSLPVMTEATEQECGERPQVVLADSGYYSMENIKSVEASGIEVFVPDPLLARELQGGIAAPVMNARQRRRTPGLHEMRERLRSPAGCAQYRRRKGLVESVFGTLKQQRGMRQFRRRGLVAVGTEWALATTAFNLTRLFVATSRTL